MNDKSAPESESGFVLLLSYPELVPGLLGWSWTSTQVPSATNPASQEISFCLPKPLVLLSVIMGVPMALILQPQCLP